MIVFILSNFTLSFLVVGFFTAFLMFLIKRNDKTVSLLGITLSHLFFFSYGFSFFYNFIMHVFFGDMAAEFIGWQQSPFQLEVGFASLGFSLVGFLAAFSMNPAFRISSILGVACFLWGAGGGHVYQMIQSNNFSPGNAGIIFWTDVFLPLLSMVLFYFNEKNKN